MSALEMCLHWLKAGMRRFSLWTSLSLACLLAASTAMGEGAPLRYLFLVETSSATGGHKDEVLSALSARLASGLQGQMRPGEMFVVWTYDQTVATDRYLPAAWNRRTRELLATRTARALGELWFTGRARLDKALAEALKVAKASDALTVLIVNSGSSRIVGTPFDEQINAAYLAGARDEDTTVFVTSLLARRGQVVGWTVEPASPPRDSINQTAPLSVPKLNVGTLLTNLDAAAAQKPVYAELPVTTALAPGDSHRVVGTPVSDPSKATTSSPAAKTERSQPARGDSVLPADRPAAAAVPSTGASGQAAKVPVQISGSVAPVPTAVTPVGTSAPELRAVEPPPKPAPSEKSATVEHGQSEQVRKSPATARRPDSPAPAAGAVLVESSSGAGKFLVIGLALLVCALAGLVYFVRARNQGEQSSLISKSIAARK